MIRPTGLLSTTLMLVVLGGSASAQQPADTAARIPAVGSMAPEFTFRPITSRGISPTTANLSDYRGQTVVLWFFVKARTRG